MTRGGQKAWSSLAPSVVNHSRVTVNFGHYADWAQHAMSPYLGWGKCDTVPAFVLDAVVTDLWCFRERYVCFLCATRDGRESCCDERVHVRGAITQNEQNSIKKTIKKT